MVSIKVLFGSGRISQSINFYPLSQFGVVEDKDGDGTVNYRTYKNDTHPVYSNYSITVNKEQPQNN